jgi:hypothetical protein
MGMEWILLAQDRYKWKDLLNMVMNVWLPYMRRIS